MPADRPATGFGQATGGVCFACQSSAIMSKSRFVPDIKRLDRDKWNVLRDLRLTALTESPKKFLATSAEENRYAAEQWIAEFDRGSWYICQDGAEPVGLIGIVYEPEIPYDGYNLESLWVKPGYRKSGIASELVAIVLRQLREARCEIAYLWIIDGNDEAMGLYKKLGFVSTNERQELPDRPGEYEERMMLHLR
jgi:ribosomal protein S18 acetylase RimI-like enzyme